MAKATVVTEETVTLTLSGVEAENLFHLLGLNSTASKVDTFPVFNALWHAFGGHAGVLKRGLREQFPHTYDQETGMLTIG